jgi:lysophospholipase L1-like esterase
VTDSVLLGATPTLVKSLSDWQVTVVGRSAMMISNAMEALRRQPGAAAPVVVVGLGHNSVWEKDRRNFERWSATFDKSAEDMLALLRQRGAQKIVWLTVRECSLDVLPKNSGSRAQYREWCWWFPYVNERLRAIKEQHPDMALADWTKVARRPGVTYDSIHVNVQGAQLMTALIRAVIGIDAPPAAGLFDDGVQKTAKRAAER